MKEGKITKRDVMVGTDKNLKATKDRCINELSNFERGLLMVASMDKDKGATVFFSRVGVTPLISIQIFQDLIEKEKAELQTSFKEYIDKELGV